MFRGEVRVPRPGRVPFFRELKQRFGLVGCTNADIIGRQIPRISKPTKLNLPISDGLDRGQIIQLEKPF